MSDADKIDEYELINCVATGSTTQIWEVKKSGNNQPLAMKLLLDEALADPEAKKALKHEATIGKMMEHPNIINIFDLKISKKVGYFTMEYFRAGNLKSLIRGNHALAQARSKKLVEALAQALGYFHEKGWIHRDVKPDNVLLNKGGEVRLIDFSLSSKPSNAILRAVTKKKNIVIQGTRTYLAPELIRREALTHSSDIYSLGILFYETLVGFPPFRTANPNDLLMMHVRDKPVTPSDIDDNITPEADAFALRLLGKKPADRPATMQEVHAEIRSLKLFKEDPIKVHQERKEAMELSDAQSNEDRLNSRMDATRDRSKDAERKPAPKPKPKPIILAEEKKKEQAAPAAGAPPQPGMPPGMPMPGYPQMYPGQMPPGYPMPGYPGMPMPGFPQMPAGQMPPGQFPPGQMPPAGYPQGGMPGGQFPMGQPGQMPPGQMPPGVVPPGAPIPTQPGMPQQGIPQPAPPQGQPPIPQPPAATQGSAPQPAAPQPSAPQPSAPQPAAPSEKKSQEEIPLATFDDLEIE